ncbi:MAG: Hpt domain-containing protein [Thiotrichales bacterium]|nr:Hpt domain-containing protein [Thiotrichales bacterium]
MTTAVDLDNLNMLRDVIGDDLKEILQSFIDIAPDAMGNIKKAIALDNATDLRLHAHTLKGSSANIGATRLPQLALALENAGKAGQTKGLESELAAVEAENQVVLKFLKHYIEQF